MAGSAGPSRATDRLREHPMEAERINSIRNQLTDLSARVVELRGYL
jgi:hypothetical protein